MKGVEPLCKSGRKHYLPSFDSNLAIYIICGLASESFGHDCGDEACSLRCYQCEGTGFAAGQRLAAEIRRDYKSEIDLSRADGRLRFFLARILDEFKGLSLFQLIDELSPQVVVLPPELRSHIEGHKPCGKVAQIIIRVPQRAKVNQCIEAGNEDDYGSRDPEDRAAFEERRLLLENLKELSFPAGNFVFIHLYSILILAGSCGQLYSFSRR